MTHAVTLLLFTRDVDDVYAIKRRTYHPWDQIESQNLDTLPIAEDNAWCPPSERPRTSSHNDPSDPSHFNLPGTLKLQEALVEV